MSFTSYGGVSAGYVGVGAHFALHNLTISEPFAPFPLPASVLLLGSGVLGLNECAAPPASGLKHTPPSCPYAAQGCARLRFSCRRAPAAAAGPFGAPGC